MDIKGKTKENDKLSGDLKTFCRRPNQDKNGNGVYPPRPYHIKKKDSELILKWLTWIKFSDRYVSNIVRCVEGNKLQTGGMKSHDYHVFMQSIYTQWLREEKGVNTDQRVNEYIDKYFREWFKSYVDEDNTGIGHDSFLFSLSQGPLSQKVKSYPIYFVNGYKFQTIKHGAKRATANSGVCLESD